MVTPFSEIPDNSLGPKFKPILLSIAKITGHSKAWPIFSVLFPLGLASPVWPTLFHFSVHAVPSVWTSFYLHLLKSSLPFKIISEAVPLMSYWWAILCFPNIFFTYNSFIQVIFIKHLLSAENFNKYILFHPYTNPVRELSLIFLL